MPLVCSVYIFDVPCWLFICCRRRTLSRLSGMQMLPCLQIVITPEHLITKAAQCSSNKTTRRLPSSLKKHSEMTPAAQRPSITWVLSICRLLQSRTMQRLEYRSNNPTHLRICLYQVWPTRSWTDWRNPWTAFWSIIPSWGTVQKSCTSWPTCILKLFLCENMLYDFKLSGRLQPLTHWLYIWASGRSPTGDSLANAHCQCKPHRLWRTGQTGTAVWRWGRWVSGFAPLHRGKRSIFIDWIPKSLFNLGVALTLVYSCLVFQALPLRHRCGCMAGNVLL